MRPFWSSAAAGIGERGSRESTVPTFHPSRASARKSGAGGIATRPPRATAAASMPATAVTASPRDHRHPLARQTAGVRATTATQAAIPSAATGGRPISGSARLSAPNSETRKKT